MTIHLRVYLFGLCIAALLAGPSLTARGAEPVKPNVLLLIVDDLNSWLLGDTNRYAGKVVAPNIRRLAESGVVFQPRLHRQPGLLAVADGVALGGSPVAVGRV